MINQKALVLRFLALLGCCVFFYRFLIVAIPRKEFAGLDAKSLFIQFFDLSWHPPSVIIPYLVVLFLISGYWLYRSNLWSSSIAGLFIAVYFFIGYYPIRAVSIVDDFFLSENASFVQFILYGFGFFIVIPFAVIIMIIKCSNLIGNKIVMKKGMHS